MLGTHLWSLLALWGLACAGPLLAGEPAEPAADSSSAAADTTAPAERSREDRLRGMLGDAASRANPMAATGQTVDMVRWVAKRRQFEVEGVPYGFTGLPIFYYSPNTGYNYGLRVQWTDYQRWPYRYKVTLSWLRSSGGRYSHYLRLKVPDISGTGFGLRLDLSAARDIRARYYGLGNESERVGAYTDRKSGDLYRDENYYSYILEEPRLIFSLLRRIRGPLSMSMGLGLETTDVSPRGKVSFYQEEGRFIEGVPESADQSHRRVDTVDGVSGFVSVTVDWDTRDDPTIPRTGTYHEWSYESSRNSLLGLLFEEIDYRRYTFTDARYRALSDRLGLANRMIYEILDGEVPLYAYGEIGGSYRVKGAGGSDTLRGFDRQRFTDNVRLLSNTEVRYRLHAQRAFKQYLEWHGVYFVDTGQVASSSHHLGLLRTHVSSGVGLRLYWNADFVIRADLGLSVEQAYLGFKYRNVF